MKIAQHFILLNGNTPFVFVVPPKQMSITTGQEVKRFNLIDFGEKINIGERKADTITFTTFFPNIKSQFYSVLNPLTPITAVLQLKKWQNEKTILTFLVPELLISYKCSISNLDYSIEDKVNDLNIKITLVEQRQQNVITDKISGLLNRV